MCAWSLFGSKNKSPETLLSEGNLKGALKGFQAELKTEGFNPVKTLQVAVIFQKLGKPLEAKKHFAEVGDHYANLGFFNKSVAAFKKALSITPDDRTILTRMASYNDQVPKYIIGQDLQRRINEEIIQPQKEERERQLASEAADRAAKEAARKLEDERIKHEQRKRVRVETVPNPEQEQKPSVPPGKASEYADIQAMSQNISAAFSNDQDEIIDTTIGPLAGAGVDESMVLDFSGIFKAPLESAAAAGTATEKEAEADAFDHGKPDVIAMPPADRKPIEEKGSEPPAKQAEPAQSRAKERQPTRQAEPEPQPTATKPMTEPDPPNQAAPQAEPKKRFVFSKRTDDEDSSDLSGSNKAFTDFNDALDDIFSGSSNTETKQQEENRRHWALFRTMPKELFMDFVAALEMREYEGDELIVEQGSTGSDMFLIAEGEVDIYLEQNDIPTRVATLGEGDFFGEASLLTGQPRSATVRTTRPTSCLVLKRSQLKALTRDHPSILDSVKTIYYTRKKHNAALRR